MAITYHAGRRIQATSSDVPVVSNRGTIDTSSSAGNTIITFTESGTFTPTSSFNVEYLVVAGGGGGGTKSGGGGGAGGLLQGTFSNLASGTYSVVVGDGGNGAVSGTSASNGNDSSINSLTAIGGGGGRESWDIDGQNGGSGGGVGLSFPSNSVTTGQGTTGQGNNGGTASSTSSGSSSYWTGSGGGGAGGAGTIGITSSSSGGNTVGNGGAGLDISITGTSVGYAGGGSGGSEGSTPSGTASHGGGTAGVSGTDGTGGGGGQHSVGGTGGDGGSGIVIIKFATSGNTYDTSAGGKPTNVQVGSRFEETDTRKMYHYSDPMTKEFNFSSSTGWVSGNPTYFNIGSNKLNVKSDTDNIQTNMTYDLLANDSITVGTSWVMTFTLDIASPYAVNTNSGNQHRCYIGLASATTVGEPANIDEVDFTICPRSDINAHESFNNNNTTAQYVGTGVTVTSGTKYIKLIRDGNTSFKTYIYNNADYSDTPTITEASNNLSNITGTKYIKVSQYVEGFSGTLNFTIDDLKFYNDVTSTDNVWKEEGT